MGKMIIILWQSTSSKILVVVVLVSVAQPKSNEDIDK